MRYNIYRKSRQDNLRGKLRNLQVDRKTIVQRYMQLAAFRDWNSYK